MYLGTLGAVSNREDWIEDGSLINEDDEAVDLSAATIVIYVCRQGQPDSALIEATTANGKVTLPTATTLQFHFTPDDMGNLCAATYDVYFRVEIEDIVTQVWSATLPVVQGGPA